MKKEPKHLLILKIVGFVGLLVGIFGFIMLFSGFGDFESNKFLVGMFLGPIGFFIGISCLIIGFGPDIAKMTTKTIKYIQEENKEDLKDIALTSSDITYDAVKTTTEAIKSGLEDTVFCKYCGNKIDKDSKFCKYCGKNLNI